MSAASGPAADPAARHVSEARSAVVRRDAETRTSVLIGRARLATFLPAAAALIFAFSRGPIVPFAAAVMVARLQRSSTVCARPGVGNAAAESSKPARSDGMRNVSPPNGPTR